MRLAVVCPDVIAEVQPVSESRQAAGFFPEISRVVKNVKITSQAFDLLKFGVAHG